MPVTPAPSNNFLPLLISTHSLRYGCGDGAPGLITLPSSTTWPAANRAIYMPLYVDRPGIVTKLWIWNGATSSGNVDIGLYNASFTKLTSSGSTAQGTINVIQEFDITDYALVPGVYFLGLAMSSGTATVFAATPNVTTYLGTYGITQEASALPLPATATPAQVTNAVMPYAGIAFRTLVA